MLVGSLHLGSKIVFSDYKDSVGSILKTFGYRRKYDEEEEEFIRAPTPRGD